MSLYGLIIGIAIIIGLNYFEKHIPAALKQYVNLITIGVLCSALLGARAYHVTDNWTYYQQFPTEIIKTWHGGLGIMGAFAGSLIFLSIFSWLKKTSLHELLNSITPILPLCQAIGRVGNFLNDENPFWWLEAIPNLMLYIFIKYKKPADPTAVYLIGYGIIRFFSEFPRTDTWQVNSFKIAQFISILLVLSGLTLLFHENQKNTNRRRQKHAVDTTPHR